MPGCLYCGKDIGTFRLLRDSEFCSSAHRKSYGQRLGAALGRLAAPEPPPAGIADFQFKMPVQEGNRQHSRGPGVVGQARRGTRTDMPWTVAIAPVLGANALQSAGWPKVAPEGTAGPLSLTWLNGGLALQRANALLPDALLGPGVLARGEGIVFQLRPEECGVRPAALRPEFEWRSGRSRRRLPEIRLDVALEAAEQIPAPCRQWMPSAPADPAEREVLPATAAWRDFGICAPRLPRVLADEAGIAIKGIPEASGQWMPAPPAHAAEREMTPSTARFAESCGVLLPQMRLGIAPTAIEPIADFRQPELSGAVAGATMVFDRMVSTSAARLPEMQLEAAVEALERIPELCQQAMAAPAAQAAEREVMPAAALRFAESSVIRLPEMRLAIAPATAQQVPNFRETQGWLSPAAAAALAAEYQSQNGTSHNGASRNGTSRLPEMVLEAAEPVQLIPEACGQPMAAAATEAARREVIATVAGQARFGTVVQLPEMTLAVEAELVELIPEECEQPMASAVAEAAEREVIAAVAEQAQFGAVRLPEMTLAVAAPAIEQVHGFRHSELVRAPAAIAAKVAGPAAPGKPARLPETLPAAETEAIEQIPEPCRQPMPSATPEAAEREVIAVMAQAAGLMELVGRTPDWEFQIATHVPATGQWRHAEGPQAAVVQVQSQFRKTPLAALRYPSLAELEPLADSLVKSRPGMAAPVVSLEDGPLAPWPAESMPSMTGFVAVAVPFLPSIVLPALTLAQTSELVPAGYRANLEKEAAKAPEVSAPGARDEQGERALPMAGFLALDFYCETGAGQPIARLDWASSTAALALPNGALRPIGYQKEDPPRGKTILPPTLLQRVWHMPTAARVGIAAKIAACLMVVTSLWLGGRMVGNLRLSERSREAANSVDSVLPALTPGEAARQSSGPLASVRRVIARRAAVEVTDSFANGMQAWGAGANGWVKGWSRDPAGYVRPGEMALFRPSLGYKDYRLEFFGLIENKSMGWMVRARDGQNYYAMKFTTLEAGLRPIIAVAHYPVVGGQMGHRVDVPLNVMVHNNQPYHVAVNVRGNRVSTSIEGQEVDSWTDDALLASGGVGFFTDAGARARLYWMKVYKNDDLLGRICAYLAGTESGADRAELWRPEGPDGSGRPTAPAPRGEAAWAVAWGGASYAGRKKNSNRGRQRSWS